jgi:tRNA(fMet)-specific endonuclease VapC
VKVLDTNTVIYFFKGQGRVAERLSAEAPSEIALPAVVLYELMVGLFRSGQPERRRAQLAELARSVAVLPFGTQEAEHAARLRTTLETAGQPIGPLDTLIAATALAHGATLVTRNTRELGRVPGLVVEDWY